MHDQTLVAASRPVRGLRFSGLLSSFLSVTGQILTQIRACTGVVMVTARFKCRPTLAADSRGVM
jgi:hypothetical protein